jgi:nitrite reductase (NADH) large subunit
MKKLIVVGNGMVGYKFLEKLKESSAADKFEIVVFGDEPRPAYDRVHLSEYFSSRSAEALSMAPANWYKENDITLKTSERVDSIDRAAKTVTTSKGTYEYDKLVLATGSAAFMPPIPGNEKEGVFVYRTIEDLDDMIAYASKCKSAAVIGGGLLGLEAAKALVDLDLKAHVVEFASRLMPRQIDDDGSKMLQSKIEELGVSIHLNKATDVIAGEAKVEAMNFSDSTVLGVEMVVVSAGIRPRDELAKQCSLEVGERGGIVVDDKLLTNDKDIFAIGECALHRGMIYGLVAPGYRMADVVVQQLNEQEAAFEGMDMSTKLKLMGVDVSSVGDPFASGDNISEVVIQSDVSGIYKKLVINKENNSLVGAILVGDNADYNKLYQFYLNQNELPEVPESLLVQGGAEEEAGVMAMPDEAQICSCENVTKGDIVNALDSGECGSLDELKTCTKAGTGCGSCMTLVKDIYETHLENSGAEVDRSLCEHFSMTRVEMADKIRKEGITDFATLLEKHGNGGHGCEICKPTAGSIFASYVNEHILKPGDDVLQETNDRFLANIQKNGTYSVVPRVPGGEITPDQLIAIGEVAKEYKLYTKITGGARVDLFGARLEELPPIWEKLISVGLESGHAYAKSLRTVKSCVGSTWCRYGVQDSMGMAIKIENRYKGIRAPHKLKIGVSGCARECAEAQGKDVGIIATENGWNLYVCGNGGMKPQHAVLFAADIDDETLIKYVDRFLMYYIRGAERLVRTAGWFNKLEGGLKHLQDVIIDDSLDICAELEHEMEHLVQTYQCEWKTLLESPERRKHFRSFVNTDDQDPHIEFVDERGQIKPLLKEIEPALV